jgi:hypothetical protein
LLAPAPLQIRTCGTPASGSSNHGFTAYAALIRYPSKWRLHRTTRARCLAVFPSDDSMIRHSASLHWLPRATVRQLRRYYQSAPTSHRPSRLAPFRSLGRYHALLLVARQRGVAVTGSSSELRRCLNPLPSTHTRGDGGISQVPRQPLCEHALLFDPGGPDAPRPLTTHPMLPSVRLTTSAPRSVTFRGSITQPARSLSTLRGSDYSDRTPRKTRYPLAANLVGAGLSPAGLLQEVSTLCFNSHRSPSSWLSWRTNRRDAAALARRQAARLPDI